MNKQNSHHETKPGLHKILTYKEGTKVVIIQQRKLTKWNKLFWYVFLFGFGWEVSALISLGVETCKALI